MVIHDDSNLIGSPIMVPDVDRDIFIEGLMSFIKQIPESDYNRSYAEIQDDITFNLNQDVDYINAFEEIVDNGSIDVDMENLSLEHKGHGYQGYAQVLGLQTNNNGVHYFGFILGGDWEEPVYGMIYFDGKEMKIYYPKYGNVYNLDNNMAFGNETDADDDYISRFGVNCVGDVEGDFDMIKDEIDAVFQLSGCFSGTIQSNVTPKSSNSSNTNSNNTNISNPVSPIDVILKVFEENQDALIPSLQQSLINQGYTTYPKSNCFKSLNSRNDMLKDIYNYILSYNIGDKAGAKTIVVFLRKFKKKFGN